MCAYISLEGHQQNATYFKADYIVNTKNESV